jgi:phospholipid/cholesterol/gamma-HCH transport system substrate-binding protein
MENRSHALWAGFFTVAMLCAAVLAGIWLNRDKTQRTQYQIVTMHAVSGLNPQAAVRYKGLAVGRVDKIEFDQSVPGQILVDVSIDPETPVTPTTFATLGYQGVTGIAYVELDDDGSIPTRIAATAGQVPRIPLRSGLLEKLEQSSTKILASVELVSDRLAHMFAPENQKIILGAFSHTSEATERWSKVADDLGPTVAILPGLLQQTNQTLAAVQDLSKSASGLSTQLTGLTRDLQDPNGALNHTLSTFATLGENIQSDTLPRLQTLTLDAGASMKSFNQTMQELKEHPQSLLYGRPAEAPGPGEAGFTEPRK